MKKAKDAHMDPNIALQCLRATPIDAHLPSPAELLLRRKIRTNLPVHIQNQDPKRDEVKKRLLERQERQKMEFDKMYVFRIRRQGGGKKAMLFVSCHSLGHMR